jgi:hypothetical protein
MLYDIVEEAEAKIREWLDNNGRCENAGVFGLDYRCGSIWVTNEAVVVEERNRRSLEYYGGFEYVAKESVSRVGEYTIYYADGDERVMEVVEFLNERA